MIEMHHIGITVTPLHCRRKEDEEVSAKAGEEAPNPPRSQWNLKQNGVKERCQLLLLYMISDEPAI